MSGEASILPRSGPRARLMDAAAVYGLVTLAVFVFAPPQTIAAHTPYNHFALLAESWLQGRLDLGGPPPSYTGNNDFAVFEGRHYVVFPPFPALLLLPWVALAGAADRVRDGLFFLLLSGVGPAVIYLAFDKLSRLQQSGRQRWENLVLSLLLAFGSVYFFSAVQGTVWFAAHVVAVALAALYLYFSLAAERPLLAGLVLGLGFATRTPLIFAAPLFVLEAVRVAAGASPPCVLREPLAYLRGLDKRRLAISLLEFSAPLAVVLCLLLVHNAARFADPLEFGYRYLTVVWQARIEKWGLFDYHYLARNLGVLLTSLPWVPGSAGGPFQINHHGLALWVTSPFFVLLLWPRKRSALQPALWSAALGAALPSLFYQNTGWLQFGYRFSNDYVVFLFALLAVSGWSLRRGFAAMAVWAVLVNAFGAISFDRADYRHFYFTDRTQRVVYEPD